MEGTLGESALLPNLRTGSRVSCVLAALIPLVAWIAWKHAPRWWAAPGACVAAIAALNAPLLRRLARSIGWPKALLRFPFLLISLEARAAGMLIAWAKVEHRRDRFLWLACALIGLALFGIQASGGAFTAEFTAHPDEPAHFVSGLMVYDYLSSLPKGNPMDWAGNYYLHYPKVAIGQWPPGYHVMEALWWLVWGPSRATAMWLQWTIGLVAMTMLYRLCRDCLPLPAAAAIVALTIATPVFQQSLEETMADLCCLLWSVLFMHAAVRLLDKRSPGKRDGTSLFLLGLWLWAAAMTKGTAVCLIPVAVLVLLVSRQFARIPLGWILAAGAGLIAAAAWYASAGGVVAWGGMSGMEPWPGRLIGHLAGWGFVALAGVGFLALAVPGKPRTPLVLVSAAIVASTLGSSLAIRAMREERHWIIALPAILVLAGFAVCRFHRPVIGTIVLIPALALFPWSRFRQAPEGFNDLLRQVHVPSRMLVSSSGGGEGSWIAVTALAEKRPGSLIVRASKVLVEEGWNGEGYHLLTASPEAILRRIDELALDLIVVHTSEDGGTAPHHVLLRNAVQNDASWRECGHARELLAYCRVRAPRVPRQPLELRIRGMDLKERQN